MNPKYQPGKTKRKKKPPKHQIKSNEFSRTRQPPIRRSTRNSRKALHDVLRLLSYSDNVLNKLVTSFDRVARQIGHQFKGAVHLQQQFTKLFQKVRAARKFYNNSYTASEKRFVVQQAEHAQKLLELSQKHLLRALFFSKSSSSQERYQFHMTRFQIAYKSAGTIVSTLNSLRFLSRTQRRRISKRTKTALDDLYRFSIKPQGTAKFVKTLQHLSAVEQLAMRTVERKAKFALVSNFVKRIKAQNIRYSNHLPNHFNSKTINKYLATAMRYARKGDFVKAQNALRAAEATQRKAFDSAKRTSGLQAFSNLAKAAQQKATYYERRIEDIRYKRVKPRPVDIDKLAKLRDGYKLLALQYKRFARSAAAGKIRSDEQQIIQVRRLNYVLQAAENKYAFARGVYAEFRTAISLYKMAPDSEAAKIMAHKAAAAQRQSLQLVAQTHKIVSLLVGAKGPFVKLDLNKSVRAQARMESLGRRSTTFKSKFMKQRQSWAMSRQLVQMASRNRNMAQHFRSKDYTGNEQRNITDTADTLASYAAHAAKDPDFASDFAKGKYKYRQKLVEISNRAWRNVGRVAGGAAKRMSVWNTFAQTDMNILYMIASPLAAKGVGKIKLDDAFVTMKKVHAYAIALASKGGIFSEGSQMKGLRSLENVAIQTAYMYAAVAKGRLDHAQVYHNTAFSSMQKYIHSSTGMKITNSTTKFLGMAFKGAAGIFFPPIIVADLLHDVGLNWNKYNNTQKWFRLTMAALMVVPAVGSFARTEQALANMGMKTVGKMTTRTQIAAINRALSGSLTKAEIAALRIGLLRQFMRASTSTAARGTGSAVSSTLTAESTQAAKAVEKIVRGYDITQKFGQVSQVASGVALDVVGISEVAYEIYKNKGNLNKDLIIKLFQEGTFGAMGTGAVMLRGFRGLRALKIKGPATERLGELLFDLGAGITVGAKTALKETGHVVARAHSGVDVAGGAVAVGRGVKKGVKTFAERRAKRKADARPQEDRTVYVNEEAIARLIDRAKEQNKAAEVQNRPGVYKIKGNQQPRKKPKKIPPTQSEGSETLDDLLAMYDSNSTGAGKKRRNAGTYAIKGPRTSSTKKKVRRNVEVTPVVQVGGRSRKKHKSSSLNDVIEQNKVTKPIETSDFRGTIRGPKPLKTKPNKKTKPRPKPEPEMNEHTRPTMKIKGYRKPAETSRVSKRSYRAAEAERARVKPKKPKKKPKPRVKATRKVPELAGVKEGERLTISGEKIVDPRIKGRRPPAETSRVSKRSYRAAEAERARVKPKKTKKKTKLRTTKKAEPPLEVTKQAVPLESQTRVSRTREGHITGKGKAHDRSVAEHRTKLYLESDITLDRIPDNYLDAVRASNPSKNINSLLDLDGLYNMVAHGNLKKRVSEVTGLTNPDSMNITWMPGATGAYRVTVVKGKRTATVYVKETSLTPDVFAAKLFQDTGVFVPKMQAVEYTLPNGVKMEFGIMQSVGQIEGVKRAVPIADLYANKEMTQFLAQNIDDFSKQLGYVYELCRKRGLQDRHSGNVWIVEKANGKLAIALIDLDIVTTYAHPDFFNIAFSTKLGMMAEDVAHALHVNHPNPFPGLQQIPIDDFLSSFKRGFMQGATRAHAFDNNTNIQTYLYDSYNSHNGKPVGWGSPRAGGSTTVQINGEVQNLYTDGPNRGRFSLDSDKAWEGFVEQNEIPLLDFWNTAFSSAPGNFKSNGGNVLVY